MSRIWSYWSGIGEEFHAERTSWNKSWSKKCGKHLIVFFFDKNTCIKSKIGYKAGLGTPWKLWMKHVGIGVSKNSILFLSSEPIKRSQESANWDYKAIIIITINADSRLLFHTGGQVGLLIRITKQAWEVLGNGRFLLQG